ncbi:MAG TPA: 3-phosphoshikimate 1-carboxyvinyltransferase [Dehalococcoidia bacterium]|nr:3-phosphoshikimate 1-carboxyvinyltransferase [Dehalococcoidia bacterium]
MIVQSPSRLRATLRVPADKSISHRALILNAIAEGEAHLENLLDSDDVRSTAACISSLGIAIDWPVGATAARISGGGLHGLYESEDALNCGNSGTTMRLLTGLLAAHPLFSVLIGDESLSRRPMGRIIEPLRLMGARISARRGDTLAPIAIRGGSLRAIQYEMPVASAQVKSALILAGLTVEGRTRITEPAPTRDHTEKMLAAMGAPVDREGRSVIIRRPARLEPLGIRVPGDLSSAAPWLVLGACHSDAEIKVESVGINPTRTGLLDILKRMGASIELQNEHETSGEPVADLIVHSSDLHGVTVQGDDVPRAIDELPLVALLGCFAQGTTVVREAEELLVKESNRIENVVTMLSAMGASIKATADGFIVEGPCDLQGARLDAAADHRMGMLGAVAGVLATGQTRIENDAVTVSYPDFWEALEAASPEAAQTA